MGTCTGRKYANAMPDACKSANVQCNAWLLVVLRKSDDGWKLVWVTATSDQPSRLDKTQRTSKTGTSQNGNTNKENGFLIFRYVFFVNMCSIGHPKLDNSKWSIVDILDGVLCLS